MIQATQQSILEKLKINALNEMQEHSIQVMRTNKNVLLLSPTGSGKSLAFLLSIYNELSFEKSGVQALIITPTRELALQIESVFKAMGTDYKINATYGGHSIRIEKNNFSEPPAVLVGTPGRILDHVKRENINLSGVHTLVLDEFDKSLEMGFEEDMSQIIGAMKSIEKKMLVSATDLQELPSFIEFIQFERVDFLVKNEESNIKYFKINCLDTEKVETLFELLCNLPEGKTIIFCNHREAVVRIYDFLIDGNIHAVYYHGGMDQEERERALIKFRNESAQFLVATDLAARGLDIDAVEHVIHYQLPQQEAVFKHRSGRTARQNADGVVFTFQTEKDKFPDFMPDMFVYDIVPNEPLPEPPYWKTIYIGGGKKDKINKVDVVGFLHKIGGLKSTDIGMITVMDHSTLVAINRFEAEEVVPQIRDQKIKGKKFKIGFAR
jgi:ATP-independent RNA helicase DbpA